MSRKLLDEALLTTGLRAGSCFPRDLVSDVVMRLPITVVHLTKLTAHSMGRWMQTRGINHAVSTTDRALHGCLVAQAGQGIVFLDAGDNELERRFTFAHEISHFILDHLLPRLRALRVLGERILPVLDGERQPTPEEMLSAVLERLSLGVQVHLMSRGPGGAICTWDVEESEQEANHLALELLAPAQIASAAVRRFLGDIADVTDQGEHVGAHLAEQFGLPQTVAVSYATLLLGRTRQRHTLTEHLFGSK